MFRVSVRDYARHDDGGDLPQPSDNLSRFVEPPHMGVAGSEIAIWLREDRIFLDCKEEVWNRLVEATAEQARGTNQVERLTHSGAWTEPQ